MQIRVVEYDRPPLEYDYADAVSLAPKNMWASCRQRFDQQFSHRIVSYHQATMLLPQPDKCR